MIKKSRKNIIKTCILICIMTISIISIAEINIHSLKADNQDVDYTIRYSIDDYYNNATITVCINKQPGINVISVEDEEGNVFTIDEKQEEIVEEYVVYENNLYTYTIHYQIFEGENLVEKTKEITIEVDGLKEVKTNEQTTTYIDTVTDSGEVSNGVNWQWYANSKTLKIVGTGSPDTPSLVPWSKYAQLVEKVEMEDGVRPRHMIGWFKNFGNLKTIEGIKIPNSVLSCDMLFYGCYSLTSIDGLTIPDSVISAVSMFEFCEGLTSLKGLKLPNSRATISRMFAICNGLKSTEGLSIPDTVYDTSAMFLYCDGLTSIEGLKLPANLENMEWMFKECFKLTSIKGLTIPNKVTNMSEAFMGCRLLDSIEEFNLPNSLTNANGLFKKCPKIIEIPATFNIDATSISMKEMFKTDTPTAMYIPPKASESIKNYNWANDNRYLIRKVQLSYNDTILNTFVKDKEYVINQNKDGSEASRQQITEDTVMLVLPGFDDVGYMFKEWQVSQDDEYGAIKVTPIYEVMIYDIIFKDTDESVWMTKQVEYNSKIVKPEIPTKTGYTFVNWYMEKELDNVWDFDTNVVYGETILYAKWKANQYTVAFETNGGNTISNQNIDYQNKVIKPANPVKNGYTFVGWYKDNMFTNEWDFTSDVISENTTLYAKWSVNNYTVSFVMNGITIPAFLPNQTIAFHHTITKPVDPVRVGYTFVGWYRDSTLTDIWDFDNDVIPSNMTLYAKWEAMTWNISFQTNGGSAILDTTVKTDQKITKPLDPTREGYTFAGWYKDSSLTIPWDFAEDTVSSDTKLYAKWNVLQRTVSFETNGGSSVEKIKVNINEKIDMPANPTRNGYAFVGWYKNSALTIPWNFDSDQVIEDVTLYAKWEAIDWTVTFETNGGSGITSISARTDEKISEPNVPTKKGYTFNGWYKDNTYNVAWNFTKDIVKQNTILYAKWTPIAYTITYTLDGGSNHEKNPTTYTIESNTITLQNPSKINYTFVGWTWIGQNVPQKDVIIEKGTIGNLNYKANWRINEYQVLFETKGGNAITSQKITHGTCVSQPNDPIKEGFVFIGWYSDVNGTIPWNFSNPITENTTLYAKYQEILKPVEASIATNTSVDKGTKVSLHSIKNATIYYTLDGTVPKRTSKVYTEPIAIHSTMTMKAMAVADGYVDSVVTEFNYIVKGDFIIDTLGPVKADNTDKEKVMKAVLHPEEYESYLKGTNVYVRIECEEIKEKELDENASILLNDKKIAAFYDITLHKSVGEAEEEIIDEIKEPIQITLDVPQNLYVDNTLIREFSVLRIHNGVTELLHDIDNNDRTVTIESDRFSTYVFCYQDFANEHIQDKDKAILTGDYQNISSILVFTCIGLIGILKYSKKSIKKADK